MARPRAVAAASPAAAELRSALESKCPSATLSRMGTPFRTALSRTTGWLADRRIPRPLRSAVYRGYARATGADLSEVRLPLEEHPSLGAFFVRRLKEGARPIERDPALIVSPVDGTVQSLSPLERGSMLQAKGKPYPVR